MSWSGLFSRKAFFCVYIAAGSRGAYELARVFLGWATGSRQHGYWQSGARMLQAKARAYLGLYHTFRSTYSFVVLTEGSRRRRRRRRTNSLRSLGGFAASKAALWATADVLSAEPFPLDAPMSSYTPPRLPLIRPRPPRRHPATNVARRQPAAVAASSRVSRPPRPRTSAAAATARTATNFCRRSHGKNSHQLPPQQPRQEQPRLTRCHNLHNRQNPDAGGVDRQTQNHHHFHLPPCSMPLS